MLRRLRFLVIPFPLEAAPRKLRMASTQRGSLHGDACHEKKDVDKLRAILSNGNAHCSRKFADTKREHLSTVQEMLRCSAEKP